MSTGLRVGMVRVDDILFHPHNTRTNLGDLRTLTNSILRYGVMQPVVVEEYGQKLRLRAGHRRVAAARLAGLTRIPAVVHPYALDDEEWIVQSIQENTERRGLAQKDRQRAVLALRRLGCSWKGIADTFGVTTTTVTGWATGDRANPQADARKAQKNAERRATRRLVDSHRDEWHQLVAAELARPTSPIQEAS